MRIHYSLYCSNQFFNIGSCVYLYVEVGDQIYVTLLSHSLCCSLR